MASEPAVVRGHAQFAKGVIQSLSKSGGNVIYSPLAAHAALSALYQGASGTIAEKFAKVLGLKQASAAADGHQAILELLTFGQDFSLTIANKIFVDNSKNVNPDWKSIAEEKCKAEVESIDFKDTAKAADAINNWVKEKTKEKTTALYKPDDLSGTISSVVGTFYFKAGFSDEFEASNTKKLPFYYENEKKVDVPMMERTGSFFYKECDTLSSNLVEIKYRNEDFSLVIILPISKDGIANLETKMQRSTLSEITDDAKVRPVSVLLPKFKFDATVEFKDSLKEMGLEEIFAQSSDLNEVADNFEVSKVTQKVVFSVDEKGSDGDDASGDSFDFGGGANPRQPVLHFNADHPFIFLLTHERCDGTREVLLHGKIQKPEF